MAERLRGVFVRGFALLLLAGAGCGVPDLDPTRTCAGKCDDQTILDPDVVNKWFDDQYEDVRDLDLQDLEKFTADLITQEVNDLLDEVPYYKARFPAIGLYGLVDHDTTIDSIYDVRSGLTAMFGESDFATRVTDLRVRYLEDNPDALWAESSFRIKSDPSLSFDVDGLGDEQVGLSIGFADLDEDVQVTIVAPFEGGVEELLVAPIPAVKAMLGGLPDSRRKLRDMVPGQMVALSSKEGVAGFSFGGSTPFHIAELGSDVTLYARISAALHVTAHTKLDIQIIRDDDDKVVVDVGLADIGTKDDKNIHARLAISSAYGVPGDLFGGEFEIGPLDVDAGRLVEKALNRLLDKRLRPFEAAAQYDKTHTRHTVARYAFDLQDGDRSAEELERLDLALNQVSYGFLHLAENLALREGSGVRKLMGLDRTADTRALYYGLEFPILGLRFFKQTKENQGMASITIDRTTQDIFWNEFEKKTGWWTTDRDFSVTSIAELTSHDGILDDADYNLRIRMVEKDETYTSSEAILDHVDPLLSLVVGQEAFTRHVAPPLAAYQREAYALCKDKEKNQLLEDSALEECAEDLDKHKSYRDLEEKAIDTFQQEVRGEIEPVLDDAFDDDQKFASELFDLKLAVQGTPDRHNHMWQGPDSHMVTQYRLSAKALTRILGALDAEERFAAAMKRALYLVNANRSLDMQDQIDDAIDEVEDLEDVVDATKKVFRRYVKAFREQRALAEFTFADRQGQQVKLGDQAYMVLIDREGQLVKESHGARQDVASIAERKAAASVDLVKDLVKAVDKELFWFFEDAGAVEHQIVAYALLMTAGLDEVELLLSLQFDGEWLRKLPDVRLYGRRDGIRLIKPGRFSIDQLID